MKVKALFITTLGLLLMSGTTWSADPSLQTEKQKLGYALGLQAVQSIAGIGKDELDIETFKQGVSDALSGAQIKLSPQETQQVLMALQKKMQDRYMAVVKRNQKAGEGYLSANKKKKGVKTLKSGIQYTVIKSGKGKKPKINDDVRVHYEGRLVNGTVFDSSFVRKVPATFKLAPNALIKGWVEVLPEMQTGDTWEVAIPQNLAYGTRGKPPTIGPAETLIFKIELLEVNPKK
ncbi:MAG: FKBP-type peptidyl-prolyl cis-trans isomerase [Gammaproteobacteria bacterium]|nr:FKBP-type peptidyl-prolyl cis-trans isomerase [Gammaproteobacteria bacterium]MDH5693023.1 FKBP-type peptidyl-prolyl cis-trans isomerase [Gammaproteobacteria bacterium]